MQTNPCILRNSGKWFTQWLQFRRQKCGFLLKKQFAPKKPPKTPYLLKSNLGSPLAFSLVSPSQKFSFFWKQVFWKKWLAAPLCWTYFFVTIRHYEYFFLHKRTPDFPTTKKSFKLGSIKWNCPIFFAARCLKKKFFPTKKNSIEQGWLVNCQTINHGYPPPPSMITTWIFLSPWPVL